MRNDTKNNENNKPIIEVRNIGKKYDIAHMRGGYVALRDVIANIVRSPFSFLKDKAERAVGLKKKEEFWALKDISFNISKGEVVGIIGSNGAGKSTLLKILSQITPPTTGEIILRGKVGSLLEVGTGFHPELTGRENIFLNGAILGMKKKEIEKKFDEIVEFAGIGKFLDTPVKRYSSGMYVRLAFAVAAHMDPDILLVDEVLAVGDAEFQKKCLGKMDEITRQQGRTILFVSHNLSAIESLCKKSILLENGKIKMFGPTKDVVTDYIEKNESSPSLVVLSNNESNRKNSVIQHIEIPDSSKISSLHDLVIKIGYKTEKPIINPQFSIIFSTLTGTRIFTTDSSREKIKGLANISGEGTISCKISSLPLLPGNYTISLTLWVPGEKIDGIDNAMTIKVAQDFDTNLDRFDWNGWGVVYVNTQWYQ